MPSMDPITRRRFVQALAAITAAAPLAMQAEEGKAPDDAHAAAMKALKIGSERIYILIYPGFTEIDAIGPRYALGGMMGAKVEFVAKSAQPLRCESGFFITPQVTFEQVVAKPDLLIVPGGMVGTLAAIEDKETLGFVREVGNASAMVGSVCTGSLVLGAAGLLNGYNATCHWQVLDLLPIFGAKPRTDRVVFDRNRVTGGGVTAGLDFGFELVRKYRGDFYAKGMQLLGQYDPQPPFAGGGNPKTADPAVVELLTKMHAPFQEKAAAVIRKARADAK